MNWIRWSLDGARCGVASHPRRAPHALGSPQLQEAGHCCAHAKPSTQRAECSTPGAKEIRIRLASPRRAAIVMRIACLCASHSLCTHSAPIPAPRSAPRAAEPKRSTGVGLTPDVSQPGAFQYPPPPLRPIERAAVFVCVALGLGCTEPKFCSSPPCSTLAASTRTRVSEGERDRGVDVSKLGLERRTEHTAADCRAYCAHPGDHLTTAAHRAKLGLARERQALSTKSGAARFHPGNRDRHSCSSIRRDYYHVICICSL